MGNQNLSDRLSAGVSVVVNPGVTDGLVSKNGVPGNTTGSAIAASYVGEIKTASVLFASAQSLTTATTKDLVQLNLGSGVWAISGCVSFDGTGTTTVAGLMAGFGFNSSSLPAQSAFAVQDANGQIQVGIAMSSSNTVSSNDYSLTIPTVYVSKTGSDNYHLLAKAVFSTSTLMAYGSITAVRIA